LQTCTSSDYLEATFRGRNLTSGARVWGQRHAQGTAEGLKYRLDLVVCINAAQIIDVQGHTSVVYKTTEELNA
jgi:hypothetical protein